MADINLDKGKTMLLMADFSISGIGQNPVAQERQTLERAREVLDAARRAPRGGTRAKCSRRTPRR